MVVSHFNPRQLLCGGSRCIAINVFDLNSDHRQISAISYKRLLLKSRLLSYRFILCEYQYLI